jgi:PP-loop superfamily ATP-utilizing enzyme
VSTRALPSRWLSTGHWSLILRHNHNLKNDLTQLISVFKELGFMYVTLDLEGYKSGKLNQVLTLKN